MIAVSLLALVVSGVVGVVLLARWESRMAASAPKRPALLAVADEVRAARTARAAAVPAGAVRAAPPARGLQPARAPQRARAVQPARGLRAVVVDG